MAKTKKATAVGVLFLTIWLATMWVCILLTASSALFNWPHRETVAVEEKRALAARPDYRSLPKKLWGQATEGWYNDHFPFRQAIVPFFRNLNINILRSPVGYNVPGRGKWVFGRGREWPEVEDYMGVIKLTPQMVDDWRTLFEGRVAWAEAMGSRYLEVITPMKIHVHPEKVLPLIAMHRRESYREDLRHALDESFSGTNVLFLIDSLSAEVASGREVYYEEDHHENAYGCYCIYRDLAAAIRALGFTGIHDFPLYEDLVPEDVREGRAPGCWIRDRRLVVSNPDAKVAASETLGIPARSIRFPRCPIYLEQPGPHRMMVVFHDSFLRYPLSTWYERGDMGAFAIPFMGGFDRIAMLIFKRCTTELLEGLFREEKPDLIVEQFSEGRLQYGPVGLDETMRRAAAWGRGTPLDGNPSPGASILAAAVFDDLDTSSAGAGISAKLIDVSGETLSKITLAPGARRVAFFGQVAFSDGLRIDMGDATFSSAELLLRSP
ncbi:MAG: hypothetical protein ILM98_07650 [Kiritimatiellae bacterium]|nr:hypothetical protein [Kiritimatiellia bacterium]